MEILKTPYVNLHILNYLNEYDLNNSTHINKYLSNIIKNNKDYLLENILLNKYGISVKKFDNNSITYRKGNKGVSFNYNSVFTKNKYEYIIKNRKRYF